MKEFIVLLAAFALAVSGLQAGEKVYLWPEGKMPNAQGHQIAAMTDVSGKPGFKADEWRNPYIEWYDAPKGGKKSDICMILISGGGYFSTCDVGLVAYWQKRCDELGIQCVKLVYRTPRPHGLPIWQSAWEDGQRAVRLVRSEAQKRGFDPEKIATVSMSAGSHLALLLSTSSQTPAYKKVDAIDEIPCHINWAITCAIAYSLSDGIGTSNTRNGDAIDITMHKCFKFDSKTAPMCMFHGSMDVYSPSSSTQVYRKLRRMKIPCELHLYADRGHGFFGWNGPGEKATGYDVWFERAEEFMRQMGWLGEKLPEVDLMSRFDNDNARAKYEKYDVWPEGKIPDFQAHQCTPYIEWHTPTNLKTKAIQIIYSGGSYTGNGPDGFEVAPARRYLNEKGMTVVTLKYRTPRPKNLAKHTTAWQDLQRTIRLVRRDAAKRGLDPNRIGIMGSSAGGHLTLMGATSSRSRSYWDIDKTDKLPCNVQWAVGIYPAYGLTDGAEVPNVKGGNEDDSVLVREFTFDPDTCPMVFIHGDADGWAAMNSVKAWEKMRKMGVHSDLHTLALRPHCFQRKAMPGTGSYTWLDRIWEFMNHKGFNK